jgi:hypothetical protein
VVIAIVVGEDGHAGVSLSHPVDWARLGHVEPEGAEGGALWATRLHWDTQRYFLVSRREVNFVCPNEDGLPTRLPPQHPLVQHDPSGPNLSYHDDHYIIAEPEEAAAVFDHLQQELRSISLQVNPRKSQVYSKGQATITFDTRTRLEERGFEVLGRTKGIIVAGAQ